jgi:hypothetical protein
MVGNVVGTGFAIHPRRQFLGTALLVGTVLTVQSAAVAKDNTVTFDHLNQASETSCAPLQLTNGETFKVVVTNTNTKEFDYIVAGIEISTPSSGAVKTQAVDTTRKELTLQHDKKYGGYSVRVSAKPGGSTASGLTNKVWYIPALTIGWDTDFAGGFTVSKLTNPVYEVRTIGATSTVARNEGAEDAVALGLAAFVHVYHGKLPWLAATFGLGVTNQSEASYFLGPSWRFSDKGALTAGYCWGSVDRLPSGVHEGDVVTDPNVLASLGSQVRGAGFFAISFKFITVGDLFQKPFATGTVSAAKP